MAAKKFVDVFKLTRPAIFGMVHVKALPGTPGRSLPLKEITNIAVKEAEIYIEAGLDGIIIENMHDLPYLSGEHIGPEIVASMTAVASTVKSKFPDMPTGIQILKAGNKQALAVAHATGCDFIRAECFTFSHISDAGWVNASAGELLRYRRYIGAEDVMIFTDVKKKHSSHSVTSDLDIAQSSEAAEFFLSDGVIVTGQRTGLAASCKELKEVQSTVKIPVLVGSGVTVENLHDFVDADGLIVGSHFKRSGIWSNDIDPAKVKNFMAKVKELRGT